MRTPKYIATHPNGCLRQVAKFNTTTHWFDDQNESLSRFPWNLIWFYIYNPLFFFKPTHARKCTFSPKFLISKSLYILTYWRYLRRDTWSPNCLTLISSIFKPHLQYVYCSSILFIKMSLRVLYIKLIFISLYYTH